MKLTIQILELITVVTSLIYIILTKLKNDKNRDLCNSVSVSKNSFLNNINISNHINSGNNISNVTHNYIVTTQSQTQKIGFEFPVWSIAFLAIFMSMLFFRYITIFSFGSFVVVMILISFLPLKRKALWFLSVIAAIFINNFAVFWNPWLDTMNNMIKSTSTISELIIMLFEGNESTPFVILMFCTPLAYTILYCSCTFAFVKYSIALKRKANLKTHDNDISVALFGSCCFSILFFLIYFLFKFLQI